MRVAEDEFGLNYRIQAYGEGHVTVNDRRLETSLVLTRERLLPDWGPETVEDLEARHADALAALAPEVVLVGTGAAQRFPDPAWTRRLMQAGIGVEVMDTGAACRTYNILAGEERAVAVVLFMI